MGVTDVVPVSSGASIQDIATVFTGIVLIGFWREMNSLKKQMTQWQSKIDTTLFGPNGSNGISGISKDHENRIRFLENTAHYRAGLNAETPHKND